MIKEANEEEEHKGWCDTELTTNEQMRKEKTMAVETLYAKIDKLQASIAKSTEEKALGFTLIRENRLCGEKDILIHTKLFFVPVTEFKGTELKLMKKWASSPWETNPVHVTGMDALAADPVTFVQQ